MILEFLYANRQLTTRQIRRYVFQERIGVRSVERKMAQLMVRGMITARTHPRGRAGRHPRVYYLLLGGARAIGKQKLGSHHYRAERGDYQVYRVAGLELMHAATRHGWIIHRESHESRSCLVQYLVEVGRHQHGETFPPSHLAAYLPQDIAPELVLSRGDQIILCSRVHPDAGSQACARILGKYERLLMAAHRLGLLFIVVDEQQEKRIVNGLRRRRTLLGRRRRWVVTQPERLEEFLQGGPW